MAQRATVHDTHTASGKSIVPELVPYIRPAQAVPEFTLQAVLLGAFLSLTFGMVNAYLGLKIGLTVSASIPSAVISRILLLRETWCQSGTRALTWPKSRSISGTVSVWCLRG